MGRLTHNFGDITARCGICGGKPGAATRDKPDAATRDKSDAATRDKHDAATRFLLSLSRAAYFRDVFRSRASALRLPSFVAVFAAAALHLRLFHHGQ